MLLFEWFFVDRCAKIQFRITKSTGFKLLSSDRKPIRVKTL